MQNDASNRSGGDLGVEWLPGFFITSKEGQIVILHVQRSNKHITLLERLVTFGRKRFNSIHRDLGAGSNLVSWFFAKTT
jgi:hypothetical protein